MTWVKVCGLTRREDVEHAVGCGADAVGFVTAPGSPRRVDPADARRLGTGLDVTRVLVTVDLAPGDLLESCAAAGVDAAQPHGRYAAEAAAAAAAAGLMVLRPVAVAGEIDLSDVPPDQIPLLDTADHQVHGGTGRTFPWELAGSPGRRIVLAGGLGPDNVAAAVARVAPWGVDASSRLELAPGVKDDGKVREFVTRAKRA